MNALTVRDGISKTRRIVGEVLSFGITALVLWAYGFLPWTGALH